MPGFRSRSLAAFAMACLAALSASSVVAAQPAAPGRVSIEVPAQTTASSPFAITLTLPRGTAAAEGRVLLNSSAAEVVGLASLGGGAALAPAEVSGGYAFAAYNLRAATPILRIAVVPHVSGHIAISVVIDAAADGAGRRLCRSGR